MTKRERIIALDAEGVPQHEIAVRIPTSRSYVCVTLARARSPKRRLADRLTIAAAKRKKYAEDAEFRARQIAAASAWHAANRDHVARRSKADREAERGSA